MDRPRPHDLGRRFSELEPRPGTVRAPPFGFTGSPRPTFGSNLNFAPHQIVPNAVTVKLGTGGQLRVYNDQGQVHLVADLAGYFD